MHRSRISTLLIDTHESEVEASIAFWAAATGAVTASPPGEPQFTGLRGAIPGLVAAVQSIGSEQRYHLDFETDDVPAEVDRLTALGAVEVSRWDLCVTMRAPGGHLLCVIPVHSDPVEFEAASHAWP